MFGAAEICAWVDEAHDRARGLGGDVRAAAGYFTSLRLEIPFEIVPPGFPQPVVPRPSHRETPEPHVQAAAKPRYALLHAAAASDREGAEDAAIAAREEQLPAAACGRGHG
jgi:hypothetical protein